MSQAYECDFCGSLYKESEQGCPILKLPQWKSSFAGKHDWLAHITLISNGYSPFKYTGDVCPKCSHKIIDFLKSLKQ